MVIKRSIIPAVAIVTACIFGCSDKNVQEHRAITISDTISKPKINWMKLSNGEYIPVTCDLEDLLNQSRNAFLTKDQQASIEKINETEKILNKQTPEGKQAAEHLSTLKEKIKKSEVSVEEVDSIIKRVCDISSEHCWIKIDEDLWIPEEDYKLLTDSISWSLQQRPVTLKENLQKFSILIELNKENELEPIAKTNLDIALASINSITDKIKETEKTQLHETRSAIASAYFGMGEFYMNNIQDWKNLDRITLGKNLKLAAFFIREGIMMKNGIVSNDQEGMLEKTEMMANELAMGIEYSDEEIKAVLDEIQMWLNKNKPDFNI